MENNLSSSSSQLDRVMTCEQFEQVVDAILSGKYSWACVLILRFAGYNPLHYIPYRTYNRLMKQARMNSKSSNSQVNSTASEQQSRSSSGDLAPRGGRANRHSTRQLEDLSYLEDFKHQSSKVMGGNRAVSWLREILV